MSVYDLQIFHIEGKPHLRPLTARGAAWIADNMADAIPARITHLERTVKQILLAGLTVTHA